jgi:two-component system, cell cycle response regulator DivK
MKRVLVAEDNKDNFDLIQMIFDEAPFRCELVRAHTGLEVLRMVEEGLPDLILMDMVMPDMDGIEATKSLRKKYPKKRLPIIGLTAQAMTGDRETVLEAGCDEYLSKPFAINELLEKVCHYLNLED